MRGNWGIKRWNENEAHLLCVTHCAIDEHSITGERYATKTYAVYAAKRYQKKMGHYDGIVALNTRTNRVEWVRKYRIEYDIEGDYGQGYELLTCEVTRADAREQLKTYQEETPGYPYRIKTRRVKVNPDNHGGLPNG